MATSVNITNAAFDVNNPYVASLIPIPAIMFAVGVASVIIFQVLLCGRCCFGCLKCSPSLNASDKSKKCYINETLLQTCYIFSVIGCICVNHVIFIGNAEIYTGLVINTGPKIINFRNNFQNIVTVANLIAQDNLDISRRAQMSGCTY